MPNPGKLTEKQKEEIIEALKDPNIKVADLVKKYGVVKTTLYKYLPESRRKPNFNIKGKTFGEWTVQERDQDSRNSSGDSRYWCVCSCGTRRSVLRLDLVKGRSTKCTACREKEEAGESGA